MSKFRRKPVVIEAIQYVGGNGVEVLFWMGERSGFNAARRTGYWNDAGELEIFTLEDGSDGRAKHVADAGDWIICGVQGEFWPVKDAIFRETYEPVEETP